MKKITAVLLVLAWLLLPAIVSAEVHVVQPGENLSVIAQQHNTTVAAIVAANNIQNPSLIHAGNQFSIPSTASMVTGAGNPLAEALGCLGLSSLDDVLTTFSVEGVSPWEIAVCPKREDGTTEPCCIRMLGEKDENDNIDPFTMTNPFPVKFDGWRASSQPHVAGWDRDQSGVPQGGPWRVEGVTIRPW